MLNKNNIEIVVILDNIRSMHNIGSIFRTCDAIGNCSIYLCGICAQPPNKQIYKTALGATESVKWQYFSTVEKALNRLINTGYELVGVEQTKNSISLNEFSTPNKKIGLVFGNEIKGLSKESIDLCKSFIEINQYGIKKSMNVSVVAGIVLWFISNE
ncbi:MAG: RNA methyltransferase [Flavobacteriales bacterium]|jgi:23S rRNA (guanosine2251-2'-O)-methyltransferase|nr:RNA methyltransferase [Flavobacteriales bacterium]|tara:strand:- start:90 stop:560 length:471 start_codon:yes stop_codon:yes gene_type:complete